MNYFNIEIKINDLLTANGAFFAFTEQQYNDEALPGVEYKRLYAGMLCPSDNVKTVMNGLDSLSNEKTHWELANNSIKTIIWDSLANYECQITGNYSDAIDALKVYGISEADIKTEWPAYYQNCSDNDYF
jgi:hypothetical protein